MQIAYDQLERYPTVARKTATALHIEKNETGFEITSSDASKLQARIVLLATGLHDELPPLEGIEGLWGKSVFHCPYCDGYEVRGKAISVYGLDETAMHNAIKHAQASHITLSLVELQSGYRLEISDNGVGFDTSQSFPGHLGLKSMHERTEALEGIIQIESAVGVGTRIMLELPR